MANDDYLVADFSKMEGSGGRPHVPEGDYHVRITAVKNDTSKEGNRMYVWTYTGVSGKLKGKQIIDYTAITPKSLWKLWQVLEALNVSAKSDSAVKIKIKSLVGKEMAVTLVDDEYNGRVTSKVSDYMDLDTFKSGGLDDDEDSDDEDDEDDEEEEETDPLAELDRTELKALIRSESLDVKVKKSMSDDDLRAAIKEAQGDEDDDDEEGIGELELEDEDDL